MLGLASPVLHENELSAWDRIKSYSKHYDTKLSKGSSSIYTEMVYWYFFCLIRRISWLSKKHSRMIFGDKRGEKFVLGLGVNVDFFVCDNKRKKAVNNHSSSAVLSSFHELFN